MVNDWIVRLSPWILGLAALGFILTVWAASRAFRTMRTGLYYVVREEARKRGLRLTAVAVLILVAGITLGVYARVISLRPRINLPVPSNTPTVAAQLPTDTPSPTTEPSLTFTPSPPPLPPTETPTPTPTHIPPELLPPPLRTLTPLPSAVTASPNTQFGPITFGAGPQEGKCPANPPGSSISEFETGTPKICAYFLVYNMAHNTLWTAAWYKNDKYIAGDPLPWDDFANGIGIAFYNEPGRQPGRWELRLYIEDRLQSSSVFTVSVPAATPTPEFTVTLSS